MKKQNMRKIIVMSLVLGLVGLIGGSYVVKAANTDLDVTMTGGNLTLSNSTCGTAILKVGGVNPTVSVSEQTATSTIGDATHTNTTGIEVKDETGGGAGYSCIMTVTHLTTRAATKEITDVAPDNTVDFTGIYDGLDSVLDPNGTFRVKIDGAGARGAATFDWWDPAGNPVGNAIVTAATVVLSNGVSVTFDAVGDYAVDDEWSAGVDVFPFSYSGDTKGLTITPSTIHNESGSLTGVTAGGAGQMDGEANATSDPRTVMTASVNHGFGDYFIDVDLSQILHPNSLSGSYSSTATITVS